MINAIEASPNGETVTLSAAAHDGQVAVHVIDQAMGLLCPMSIASSILSLRQKNTEPVLDSRLHTR